MSRFRRTNLEIKARADYLHGFSDALMMAQMGAASAIVGEASRDLARMADWTCGKGSIGCTGGPDCTGDHK